MLRELSIDNFGKISKSKETIEKNYFITPKDFSMHVIDRKKERSRLSPKRVRMSVTLKRKFRCFRTSVAIY